MHKDHRLRGVIHTSQDVSVTYRFILIPTTNIKLLKPRDHWSPVSKTKC